CDENALKRRLAAPAVPTVGMPQAHIRDLELRELCTRSLQQRRDALDAVDVLRERREHRGLIAAARTDLENARELAVAEPFDQSSRHGSDDVRLRNRLAEADRQRR